MTMSTDFSDLDRATYEMVDCRAGGAVIATAPGNKRRLLRNRAERMNRAHGAHRYSVRPQA